MKKQILILSVLFSFVIGLTIGKECYQKPLPSPLEVKVDTLIVHDTTKVVEPLILERTKLDSVLVPVTDTMRVHDTLFVYIEREKVMWQDSLCRVYASGIMPQVDSVEHFISTKVITIEKAIPVKEKSRWGVGVSAGYGVGKGGLSPYVGVGLSYNLLSW